MRCSNCGVELSFKRAKEYPDGKLSHREAHVAALMIQGAQNKEIADILDVGIGTVKFHITSIFKKLKVNKRRAEFMFLWNSKQLDPDSIELVFKFLPDNRGPQIPHLKKDYNNE